MSPTPKMACAETQDSPVIRPGRIADAIPLTQLVNYAGEGIPLNLWEKMAPPGTSGWEVGRQRAMRDTGAFSYKNAIILEQTGAVAGCLVGYPISETVDPNSDALPSILRPTQALENLAVGHWYVNILAVMPEFRNRGYGTHLLTHAETLARQSNHLAMSIIVSDANTGAQDLYTRCGFQQTTSRPMIKDGWTNTGQNWLLLSKQL